MAHSNRPNTVTNIRDCMTTQEFSKDTCINKINVLGVRMETGSSLLNRRSKNVNFNTNAYLAKVSTD